MTTPQRLRFGVKTAPQHTTYEDMLRVWLEADTLPIIEHAWLFDHFTPLGGDPTDRDAAPIVGNDPLIDRSSFDGYRRLTMRHAALCQCLSVPKRPVTAILLHVFRDRFLLLC